jgi:hypothetical protein
MFNKTALFHICMLFAILVLSFFITAGWTYLVMLGLTALGINLPFAWNWIVVAVVWLIAIALSGILKRD